MRWRKRRPDLGTPESIEDPSRRRALGFLAAAPMLPVAAKFPAPDDEPVGAADELVPIRRLDPRTLLATTGASILSMTTGHVEIDVEGSDLWPR